MALMTQTPNQPDVSVSNFGLSGWLDGLANLSLLYGAGKIREEFPEQYSNPQNPVYQPDSAINELRLAQMQGQSNNTTQLALMGVAALAAIGLLMFALRR